ncbi:MAG TPA: hypothetical protein PLN61_07175 [bacterium]|nr:hypothetical protein [bacterium]
MKDENFGRLDPKELLLKHNFNFYVETPNLKDSTGANLKADLVVHDIDRDGVFNWLVDRVLVGFVTDQGAANRRNLWAGLAFIIDFQQATTESQLPKAGDIFHIAYDRGYLPSDSLTFSTVGEQMVEKSRIKEDMKKIMVVPNPYVVTNVMEPAIGNWERNQPRRIMFTNVPAQCSIKIFTVSGLLVDEIVVNNAVNARTSAFDSNSESNGTAFWDLRSKEGLDIAAGYYLYRVESNLTGDVKMGKFAIIK